MKHHQFLVVLVMFIAAYFPVTARAATDDMPDELTARLAQPSTLMAVRIRWPGARQSPLVKRVLELREQEVSLGQLSSFLVSFTSVVDTLPLDVDDISDVWFESKTSTWGGGMSQWVRTTLGEEQLRSAFLKSGWKDLGDRLFGLLPPPERLAEFEAMIAASRSYGDTTISDDEVTEYRAVLMEPTSKVKLVGDGWLVVSPDFIPDESKQKESAGDRDSVDQEPPFPMNGLFELNDSILIAVAFNVPDNDAMLESDGRNGGPPKDTIVDIHRRITEIERNGDVLKGGYLADFLITVQDLDGALAIDLVARRPGGGGETETANLLDLILLGARLEAGTDHQLSRELSYARVSEDTGEVRAECILSQSTLIDNIEDHVNRRAELKELYQRLRDLQAAQREDG